MEKALCRPCSEGTQALLPRRVPVVQGSADGNIAVIGHDGEEKVLSGDQQNDKKDLCSTSQVGDGPSVPEGVGHGFGENGGDAAKVKEGEVE